MKKNKNPEKIIPINRIDAADHWVLIPSRKGNKRTRRIKELYKKRNNCFFARGVPSSIFDFIYRSAFKLGLKDKNLIFSRGSVRRNGRPVCQFVDIEELEWDVGISIIIPKILNYKTKVELLIDNKIKNIRLMELIVLIGLLKIAMPAKAEKWYSSMAAAIISGGWPQLDKEKTPEVFYNK